MKKVATWTGVAAIAAVFSFGGVSAEAHSPKGYCANNPEHAHCVPSVGFPNIGDFLGPFVALGTCDTTANECELAKVGDYCKVDSDCQGEINGKAAMNSYGLYLVETIGLEPGEVYDVCLAGFLLQAGGLPVPFIQNLNDNAGTTESGNLSTDGRLEWLEGKTIIGPSIQISWDPVSSCETSAGPIVQETGLTGIPFTTQ